MALVKENQGHRWKEWLGEGSVRRILEDAAEEIAWAWGIDKKDSRSYPVNTAETLYQIKERIKECLEPRKPLVLRKPHRGIVPSPPNSFSDLIYDRTVTLGMARIQPTSVAHCRVVFEEDSAAASKCFDISDSIADWGVSLARK